MKTYRIAFIGHREIGEISRVSDLLKELIKEMINSKERVEFYVAAGGIFAALATAWVKMEQKEVGEHNSRVLLVKQVPKKDDILAGVFYNEILYPIERKPNSKSLTTKRNRWMIDHADLLVAYVEPDRQGEAMKALKYAEKKGVKIINLAI